MADGLINVLRRDDSGECYLFWGKCIIRKYGILWGDYLFGNKHYCIDCLCGYIS